MGNLEVKIVRKIMINIEAINELSGDSNIEGGKILRGLAFYPRATMSSNQGALGIICGNGSWRIIGIESLSIIKCRRAWP